MPYSRDPLHYGLRALEEMAREQASVTPPARVAGDTFAPHPVLRPPARDGAALSLRLFVDEPDDAVAFVLRGESELRLTPVPPRAAALFEAHAAAKASEAEETMILGFPLVTFLQQGGTRAAPLFSRGGARARWTTGEATWRLPRGARDGAPMPLPDGLVLEASEDATFGLHGGLWYELFGLDGPTLARLGAAGRGGLGALVRTATRVLEAGEGAAEPEAEPEPEPETKTKTEAGAAPADDGPLTEADLVAFCGAAARRAHPRRGLRCFPHALVMLPPRGDPTSSLRTELRALADQPSPPRGPLAVYLGAPAAPPREAPLWSSGKLAPTPSQMAAARAFEGSSDLVAVCGPPGCGKTALLHHVAAQTVVAAALGKTWTAAPPRVHAWPLVVTSTNNAAVDHALAPFVRAPALPLALRFGNRRLLAEATGPALAAVESALAEPGALSLPDARAAFEALAAPVRARLRDADAERTADAAARARRGSLEVRATALRALLVRAGGRPPPDVTAEVLDAALTALDAHGDAAARLTGLHLDGPAASPERAAEKWARANELRGPRIAPALAALGLATPYGPLEPDPLRARADIVAQRAAIEATRRALDEARALLAAAAAPDELAALEAELARPHATEADLAPDPALYDAALAVRDAWARAHRLELAKRLAAARAALADDRSAPRTKPLGVLLQELSALFPVVGCTLLSLRAAFPLEREVIDRLVIDEAAQCAPVYAIPALARARRAMLTGDVAQLPPVYTLDPRVDARVSKGLSEDALEPFRMSATSTSSAQAVAEPRARARGSLVEHFRSQAPIVAIASRWSGHVLDVRTPARGLGHVSRRLTAPVIVVPVDGEGARASGGVVNEGEADEALALVVGLLEDGVAPSDVAVLTPFVGQSHRIERALYDRGLAGRDGVLVSTVHKLQGGERRVVVFSVTATAPKHLRWLAAQPHLLHVATSRAQDHLVVLVSPTAARREPVLAPFAELL